MRISQLTLREFRRFQHLSVSFGDGLIVVTGVNGAGKSTLLEGILWALYGPGSVRRSEASLRRLNAADAVPTRVELSFATSQGTFTVARELLVNGDDASSAAVLRRGDGELLAEDDDVADRLAEVIGATRDELRHACVTGRRELQQLAQLRPAERLRALARLLGRSVSRRTPMDHALLEAVQALQQELAEADERIAALQTAPDLLAQYTQELTSLRRELADAEASVDRLQDEWSQKRQDVDTRLLAAARRTEELDGQIDKLSARGGEGTCPTCAQPLGEHADAVIARLDDEHYVLAQDAKWLAQRQAQLVRRPPDLMEAETRQARLRAAVADRTERAARCEQAMQELWTVAGERKRAAERLTALRREPAAAAVARAADEVLLSRSDLDAVASLAGRFLADVTSGRYDAVELTDDGLVYAVADGVAAPVV
ncbi:MAG TPA: AAA family ATPase, partial [Longimicrobiales bacterium]|nr:AAA family ATPase [Longimicrobiales bacterium]